MITFLVLTLHWIVASFLTIRIIYRKFPVGTTLAWLSLLYFIPFIGIGTYLLIGETRIGNKRRKRIKEISTFYSEFFETHALNTLDYKTLPEGRKLQGISKAAAADSIFHAYAGNHLTLLQKTDDMIDSMIRDILSAKSRCVLEFYIVHPKGRIIELLETLIKVSENDINCTLMADAVGSGEFFKSEWPDKLRAAGITVIEALPVGVIKSFLVRSDLRNHRKILVIDSDIAYTGSFNLVDPRFFKQDSNVGQWVDVMTRCEGPIVLSLAAVFYADAFIEEDRHLENALLKTIQQTPEMLMVKEAGEMTVQTIASGPDQPNHVIYESLVAMIHSAENHLIITTPYFVPDEALLLAITNAARRGVDVTLVVPKKVDSLLVRHASRSYFSELLACGVKIAEFDNGLLHSKTLIIDQKYCVFGTVNMDMRSFYLNLEISLVIYNADFVSELMLITQSYLAQSEFIDYEKWQQRSFFKVFTDNLLRLTSPLL